jgi:hypothetical protein
MRELFWGIVRKRDKSVSWKRTWVGLTLIPRMDAATVASALQSYAEERAILALMFGVAR